MTDTFGTVEHEDLGAALGRAHQAARRGEVDALERELVRLRQLQASRVASVSTKLRNLARSVQAHPSFRAEPEAKAG